MEYILYKILDDNNYKCLKCGRVFNGKFGFLKHFSVAHLKKDASNFERATFLCNKVDSPLANIPYEIVSIYLSHHDGFLPKDDKLGTKFSSFYKMITVVRPFDFKTDFDLYYNKVLPWKLAHPKQSNNKELCSVIFENKEEADKLYQSMLNRNPYYQHGSELSPFSKDFNGYKNLSDEESEQKVKELAKHVCETRDTSGGTCTQLHYYLNKGYDEETAKKMLSERQRTFSKETCIKKYGEEEGLRVWKERQEKWLNSFPRLNYSLVSQELFWMVYEKLKDSYKDFFFATFNNETKQKGEENKNYEYTLKLDKITIKPDFYIPELKKIIEFDGDYWHGNSRGNQERDRVRDANLNSSGYQVLHVQERQFKENPNLVLENCIKFLKS